MKFLITESQFKGLSTKNETKVLEKQLNKIMPKIFDWWKEIEITNAGPSSKVIIIEGVLKVPIDWGYEQWEEFHYSNYFPSNDAWENVDASEKDYVSLGDIINEKTGDVIRENISTLWSMITGEPKRYVGITSIFLKFV